MLMIVPFRGVLGWGWSDPGGLLAPQTLTPTGDIRTAIDGPHGPHAGSLSHYN